MGVIIITKIFIHQVRAAWSRLALTLCQRLPKEALESTPGGDRGERRKQEEKSGGGPKTLGGRLATSVLARLEEKEAAAVGPAWDAALALVGSYGGWHAHASPEKALLPRLRAALRAGAHGCGADVYPKLLPLLGAASPAAPAALLAGAPAWISEGLLLEQEEEEEEKEEGTEGGSSPVRSRVVPARGAAETKHGVRAFFECALLALRRHPDQEEAVVKPVVDLVRR